MFDVRLCNQLCPWHNTSLTQVNATGGYNFLSIMNEIIILCTVDSEELGEKIATDLVENSQVACVNIVPGIRSIYRWEGKLCRDAEFMLVIKSVAGKFNDVRERIRQLHTYRLPEVIAIPIADGDAEYLRWLREAITP